jgi:hypothetical protein
MLFGVHHMMHGTGSAVGTYEHHGFVDRTYVIGDHRGFGNHSALTRDNDELESRLLSWPLRSILPIQGTWLATLDSGYFNEESGQRGYPGVDAYLYVGRRDLLLREPRSARTALDSDYLAELERRAMNPAVMLEQELESSTFSYDEGATPPGMAGSGGTPATGGSTGCDVCVGKECSAEMLACVADAATCGAILTCSDSCADRNRACFDACADTTSNGDKNQTFEDLVSCVSMKCQAACGF